MNQRLIDIHTHQTPCQATSPTAAGIHPWNVEELSDDELQNAVDELVTAPVQVIGETGLDYLRGGDKKRQREVFEAQLRVAERRRLAVVIHCVRAFEETMEILACFSIPAVVFHGFIGSPEQARRAVEKGYFLSFGMRSFRSPRTVDAMRATPLDHIFLETDDDPTPISKVYSRAAELLEIPAEKLAEQIEKNYGVVVAN